MSSLQISLLCAVGVLSVMTLQDVPNECILSGEVNFNRYLMLREYRAVNTV